MFGRIGVLILLAGWWLSAQAQVVGILSVVQGDGRLIRGQMASALLPGMSVMQGDIVEADGAFVVAEFQDGATLGLAGNARLLVFHHRGAKAPAEPVQLYLLNGWAKLQGAGREYRLAHRDLSVGTGKGSLVMAVGGARDEVFVEAGPVQVQRFVLGRLKDRLLGERGQFIVREPGKTPVSAGRPDAAFLAGLPRPFRDPLPHLAAKFAGEPVKPPKARPAEYGEVAPWLKLESPWNGGMTARFRGRLQDPEFLRAVKPDLGLYPEWDRIVNPEKYHKR